MAWGRKLEKDLRRRWNLNETLRQKKKKRLKVMQLFYLLITYLYKHSALFIEHLGIPLQYSAWKIQWMEEPGRLQSMGSLRVGHDWATSLSLFTFMHWRRKWQRTPVFLPGESQGQGSLVAAVCGITQNRTQLKWLSSSNISQALSSDAWDTQ